MNYLDFFGSRRSKDIRVNMVFGDVADSINTPLELASDLDINESDIKLFEIDNNNNIRFNLSSILETPNSDKNSIIEGSTTFWYDFEGKLNKVNNLAYLGYFRLYERFLSFSNYTIGNQDFRLTPIQYLILKGSIQGSGNSLLGSAKKVRRAYLENWVNTGSDNSIIGNQNTGNEDGFTAVFYFNSTMATIDNGNPHPSILNLLVSSNYTNDVRYVQNKDKPNPVTDLIVSNITANSAQLNFTPPPVNTNANDFYYVYIDYIGISFKYKYSTLHEISAFFDEITGSGATITGLPSGTEISVQVQTVDFYHNVSGYSNKVTFTTL